MTNEQESEEVRLFKETKIKAEQGDEDAQEKLGWMYCHGFGVPQDKEEAVKWYRKAAEQGDAEAQYELGNMCMFFHEPPDEDPVKWFRKAAEQGHADAQAQLGELLSGNPDYEVTDDVVEGYAWLLLAEENGGYHDGEEFHDLEERLTVKQGKKGQARAAALRRLIEERKENPKPSVESP